MATAKEKAEARRRAILARGGDRLQKLTVSARGEDATVYNDDAPLAASSNKPDLREFVGEQTRLPTPPVSSRNASASSQFSASSPSPPTSTTSSRNVSGSRPSASKDTQPDPSVWSEEHQRQFMAALMGGAGSQRPLPGIPDDGIDTPQGVPGTTEDDPIVTLFSSLMQQAQASAQGQGGAPAIGPASSSGGTSSTGPPIPPMFNFPPGGPGLGGFAQPPSPPKPKTVLQKVMPLVHIVAAWALLAYFILWKEPQVFEEKSFGSILSSDWWRRWAELGWKAPADGWGVQMVPFFWAFTTLTIILHTWRIFSGLDRVQPHTLIQLALPHLPPPFPSLILNGLKYLQIGGVFLDDIAALVFAVGALIWIGSWVVD